MRCEWPASEHDGWAVRKRLCLVLIAVGLVAGLVVALFNGWREPSYGGRRLNEWVLSASHSDAGTGAVQRAEAMEAFRQMGTNARPFLLRWIV